MLFNSIDFAVFLPLVFVLYWFVTNRSLKLQNLLIVVASYIFYGWWDWRFLFLLFFSTILDYSVGLLLSKQENRTIRLILLWTSISVNIGLLGFFKYYNFFADSFVNAFSFFGIPISNSSLNIILPVGISFYTFQTLSYSIDVYRKKLEPTSDLIAFCAFVTFFPQLVAGPIERATDLLPQFYQKRSFDHDLAIDGLKQTLWGFFKKLVIADNCAVYANQIFSNYLDYSGSTLLFGTIFFAFQIYGDFSGYSDIAVGISRIFGFRLMRNFAYPYFSRDIAEFWRRWHISLSTWFRDYVYIPLGGSKADITTKIRNTFVVFVVSGFWHGANWTFILWGALNAIFFLPLLLFNKNRKNLEIVAKGKLLPSIADTCSMAVTFALILVAWVFFRAETVQQSTTILTKVFSASLIQIPDFIDKRGGLRTFILVIFFVIIEWIGREDQYAIAKVVTKHRFIRWLVYSFLIFSIGMFKQTQEITFIYFQF